MRNVADRAAVRVFGGLLLLSAGVLGVEGIVGSVWMDIAPLEPGAALAGWGMVVVLAGFLSLAAHRIKPRLPRWHRWIFGFGMGVVLPLRPGFDRPASVAADEELEARLCGLGYF